MTLKNRKGSIKYLQLENNWIFCTGSGETDIQTQEIYNCIIEETDRNTFLVKTETKFIKEYFPSAIRDVTYHLK